MSLVALMGRVVHLFFVRHLYWSLLVGGTGIDAGCMINTYPWSSC